LKNNVRTALKTKAECEFGGWVIELYFDSNNDGVRQASEFAAISAKLCKDDPATDTVHLQAAKAQNDLDALAQQFASLSQDVQQLQADQSQDKNAAQSAQLAADKAEADAQAAAAQDDATALAHKLISEAAITAKADLDHATETTAKQASAVETKLASDVTKIQGTIETALQGSLNDEQKKKLTGLKQAALDLGAKFADATKAKAAGASAEFQAVEASVSKSVADVAKSVSDASSSIVSLAKKYRDSLQAATSDDAKKALEPVKGFLDEMMTTQARLSVQAKDLEEKMGLLGKAKEDAIQANPGNAGAVDADPAVSQKTSDLAQSQSDFDALKAKCASLEGQVKDALLKAQGGAQSVIQGILNLFGGGSKKSTDQQPLVIEPVNPVGK
jgi:hypothetical protein